MAGNDRWNLNRVGRAAAATTVPGQPPAYGLALDLGTRTAPVMGSEQYQDMMRDLATRTATQQLESSAQYQTEMESARNYQDLGYFMSNQQFMNTEEDSGFFDDVMTGVNLFKSRASDTLSGIARDAERAIPIVGGYLGSDVPETDYEAYKAAGGFLSEDDFNSFDEDTRLYLVARAEGQSEITSALGLPGIEQAAKAFMVAYRGAQVPFIMTGRAGLNPVDPMWLQSGEWASAWRKSQDMSLGNAIVDSILQPWVGEEKVDRWKRDSSIYQLTSLGTELGAGWYMDPGVLLGQSVGTAARFTRGEMPLNEQGRAYRATAQALQREKITVGGLPGLVGKYSAKRVNSKWGDVAAYAKTNTFSDFANLRMFRHRDIDGSAAASALYWAFREAPESGVNLADFVAREAGEKVGLNYPDMPTLTQQLLHGDPKAYDDFSRLKNAAPEELDKFAPGAQTFIDAIEATKTKIPQLQKEMEDLAKVEPKSAFHNWSVHTEIDRKLADIEEADEILNKYDGYGQWLDTMSNAPKVSQVNAKRGLFMDNQFGRMHAVTRYTRPMWIKKANTAEMHDVDSGTMSIRRQFEQFDHLFGYRDELALDDYMQRWITAKASSDRYETMRELEEVHLINAAAQKFEVDPEVIRVVYDKIIAEQNRTLEGIRRGQEHVFSTAPTLQDRLSDPASDIGLVSRDPDTGMVTLELMDNGQRHTVTVPESALEMKQQGPIDPTQTYNYYQPIDTRRFYLELKRNRDVVQDMSAAGVTRATAATFVDAIGTRFNSLWKPAVLFRFGWPMRVLMDENMRAMAVLGIPAFGKYYGEAYGKAANNATVRTAQAVSNRFNAVVHNPFVARKTGRKEMNIGPGPVARSQRYTKDPVARDTDIQNTPRVPEAYVPVLDNGRYDVVATFVADYEAWQRRMDKKQAWDREMDKRTTNQASVLDPIYDGDPADATPALQRAIAQGLHDAGPMPYHPMSTIHTTAGDWLHYPNLRRTRLGSAPDAQAVTFDPLTGAVEQRTGWAVPLRHTRLGRMDERFAPRNYLVNWYAEHRELLGSTGHRILVDEKGDYYVARVYQNRYKRKAQAVAEFTESGGLYDMRSGKLVPLKEWNDLTPTVEAAHREFVSTEKLNERKGSAPFGGPKRLEAPSGHVVHGTYDTLPEELLPRTQAPMMTGRMVGEGFYTTTSKEVAEGFGPNLYTLRGAKDGKTYKIFDMDKVPSKAELKRLLDWVKRNDPDRLDKFEQLVFLAQRKGLYRYYSHFDGEHPWLDYMTDLHSDVYAQRLLTRYLEEQHGAGALTHQGGAVTGHGNRVYVWLDPENLLVRPLYEPSGQYVPFVEWLYHPLSKEVPIPENRVIRTGTRNPMFRELHQNHRLLMEREADLKARGKGRFKDDEFRQRLARQNEIMDTLGLNYTKNGLDEDTVSGMKRYIDDFRIVESEPHQSLGQDWYVMTDPQKFGRVYDEAAAQDRQFDAGTRTGGALRAQEMMVDFDPEIDFDMDLDSVHSSMLRAVLKRRDAGKGFVKTKTADGTDVFYPSAYEGHKGEMMRSLVSSQGAMEMLSDGHGAATSLFRRQANGHKAYQPPRMDTEALTKGTKANQKALEYFNQWGDLLNSQIAHSPIWSKMLNGWSDEKVARWLDSTPEGAAIKRELGNKYVDTDLWVNEHRAKLDYYLPSKKLQRLLGKERIPTSQLRRQIPEEDYPTVFGPDIEFLTKAGAGETVSWIADRIWHSLGTLPIDTLSRHPFARAMYDLKMKSLIAQTDVKWMDDRTLARFETEARKYSREQVRKTLWDLVDQTNFTDALRFVAPFWGAQSEAIVKWGKIVSDRPETIARAFVLNNAVYQNFLTVDEEGNPVQRGRFDYSPTDRVILRIPNSLRKGPFGQALETIGSVGIPIGSANTVLQGETPLLPGPGPLMTIPADKLLRMTSETLGTEFNENFAYRWLFPIGRPQHGGIRGVLDQVSPGWGRRVMQLAEGDGGISYANLMTETAREMELENRRKGLPPPTPAEIEKQAKWVWGLRIFAGLVSPVQTQFRPKHQFFIDEARRYQQEQGLQWFDKFVEDYGVAMARYTTSSSNSTVGVPPTSQGMEEWSQNKELIAKYPEWGDAIISPEAYDAEFSGDAYYAQFSINLGPGDDTPLRESQSLRERFAAADARAGWYEFRKIDAVLDVQLEARGLTSLQQTGAEDLAQIKSNFIADLTKRNEAWREEYNSFNNDIYSRVNELEQWVFQPTFDNRPDIQGVRQYLMIRDQVTAELDRYAAETGGSRSLQAAENAALRDWFYTQVGGIARANPAFAEFYGRHLSQDTLMQGSGGF